MSVTEQLKEVLNSVDGEDFIITIPIVAEEGEVSDGGKEIQVKSSSYQNG